MPDAITRVIYDAFYHMPPGQRIGPHIATGGFSVNSGRYMPGDCYHPNGLAYLEAALSSAFEMRLLAGPYSDLSLFDADILLIINPDYPLYPGTSPYRWTPADVDALMSFLQRGGGVLLCVNSFLSRPSAWDENFDLERVSLLFDRLGIEWDRNFMSECSRIQKARSGNHTVGYGQGGRVNGKLPAGCEPLVTYDDNVYGLTISIGRGKLVVLGDAGMVSNGLFCFPGFDNRQFIVDLFHTLTPRWCEERVGEWVHNQSGHLSAAPAQTGLTESLLRSMRPEAEWIIDNHYRHMHWNLPQRVDGDRIWKCLPVDLSDIGSKTAIATRLNWLMLDDDQDEVPMDLELNVSTATSATQTDLHILGSKQCDTMSWADLCRDPARMEPVGTIARTNTVFELRAVVDADKRPVKARWSQGQMVYARNADPSGYGYSVVLTSRSGAIVPQR